MKNGDLLKWWDSKPITERIELREKYLFASSAAIDVDDIRFIYESQNK